MFDFLRGSRHGRRWAKCWHGCGQARGQALAPVHQPVHQPVNTVPVGHRPPADRRSIQIQAGQNRGNAVRRACTAGVLFREIPQAARRPIGDLSTPSPRVLFYAEGMKGLARQKRPTNSRTYPQVGAVGPAWGPRPRAIAGSKGDSSDARAGCFLTPGRGVF